ncbi:MAG: BMP family ABC transporter substrate-binding protein [Actinomycetota bacterium]
MNIRFVVPAVAMALLAAACGGGTVDSADGNAAPPAALPVSEIVETVTDLALANTSLDDFCQIHYGVTELQPDIQVGLVSYGGSVDDGTFNQAAFEGMEAAGRCFGLATTFLESAGDTSEEKLADLIADDVDVLITVGFQFQEPTVALAASNPDVRFIGVDQANPDGAANYVAISFRDDQVGFLAGAAAAMLTESGTVGVVAGPDTVPPVVAIADGFEAGAVHIDADVDVLREHLDTFADPLAGSATAEDMVDGGADVIFGAAGGTGSGAIATAAGLGAWAIGVDQDEYFTTFAGGAEAHADRLVTSAMKRVDLGVFLTLAAMVTSEVEGDTFLLDVANGVITYAPNHGADVSDETIERMEAIRRDLASGDLEID